MAARRLVLRAAVVVAVAAVVAMVAGYISPIEFAILALWLGLPTGVMLLALWGRKPRNEAAELAEARRRIRQLETELAVATRPVEALKDQNNPKEGSRQSS